MLRTRIQKTLLVMTLASLGSLARAVEITLPFPLPYEGPGSHNRWLKKFNTEEWALAALESLTSDLKDCSKAHYSGESTEAKDNPLSKVIEDLEEAIRNEDYLMEETKTASSLSSSSSSSAGSSTSPSSPSRKRQAEGFTNGEPSPKRARTESKEEKSSSSSSLPVEESKDEPPRTIHAFWVGGDYSFSDENSVKTLDHKRGLYTKRNFGKDEIIAHYQGKFLSPEDFRETVKGHSAQDWDTIPDLKHFVTIHAEDGENEAKERGVIQGVKDGAPCMAAQAQHSEDLAKINAALRVVIVKNQTNPADRYKVALVASRSIRRGEEVVWGHGREEAGDLEEGDANQVSTPSSGSDDTQAPTATTETSSQEESKEPKKAKHQCPACQKVCKNSSNLKDHMTKHSNERPHKCKECGIGFKTDQACKAHFKSHNKKQQKAAKK